MISTLLDRLFQRSNVPSGAKVKQRLKFILAHDRAAIEPQVFDNMRHEIMRVVSKYVELDEGSLDIRLESDKRMTALIANLPIRMVREDMPDLEALFDRESDVPTSAENKQTDASALEMDLSAEAALDAIAAKENAKSASDNYAPENIAGIAERTTEVTSKLRTAANKSQIYEVVDTTLEIDKTPQTLNHGDSACISPEKLVEADMNSNREQLEDPLPEPSGDQLELSLDLPKSTEFQEIVIEETPELHNPA
ncbi:MAG: cell division topological specificity factor MinE [Pseudanabaena frigida]|uniref:Cell division topological specificity factor n=1 Tax=Pseudanabaena frigida TaxID=945775 RepID=A0A2W4VVJ3_9CYAN|nr:MAG: cell division topological specificity factor MinE [Pseudanabaena frigida]